MDYTTGANDGANSPDGCGPTLVVLHPWSWLGGCMDDHVVVAVCRLGGSVSGGAGWAVWEGGKEDSP